MVAGDMEQSMRRDRSTLAATLLAICVVFTAACAPQAPRSSSAGSRPSNIQLAEAYGRLPLHFEENRGQGDVAARFIARTGGGPVVLGPDGLRLTIDGRPVRLTFAGGTPQPAMTALTPLPGRVNYYVGKDPANWRTDIPTFARVRYAEVYPGIDVVVYGNQRQLEYDFVVAPGADPRVIRVGVDGADAVELDAGGNVIIQRGDRTIVQRAPVVYQEQDGRRQPVAARYIRRGHEIAFDLGPYDRSRPLVIDPVIIYSARIGSGFAVAIAVDDAGNAYFAGNDDSGGRTYPTVNPAYQQPGGYIEMFVTKLSPSGASIIYSTYIGGFFHDTLLAVAADGAGNAYITGSSDDSYPTTAGSFQPTADGRGQDSSVSFVTKFDPTGAIVYSTFLDGTTFDNPADPIRGNVCYQGAGNGIAADSAGHAYVVGWTSTNDFPTTPGAYIATKPTTGSRCNTYRSGYLTKLSPDGSSLVYSTYLDGNGRGQSVAVDAGGNAYVGGESAPPSAPPGTLTASLAASGATTGFYVTKFNATGFPTQTTIIDPAPVSLSLVADASVYIAGGSFAGRMKPDGTAWLWSTSVAGTTIRGIAATPDGSAWVAGVGGPSTPTKDPLRPATHASEAVVLKFSPNGSLLFGTPLGEGGARGVDVDSAGNAYVTGGAGPDFLPTTPGAYSAPPSASGGDVFVLKLSDAPAPPPTDAKPTVTITKPSGNVWTGNSIVVAASASDDVGLKHIKLWGNSTVFATIPCSG
jgi:hypothetical protein